MNSGLNEPEIVEGLRNGCRRAWTALCMNYGAQLWRYISRLAGNDENVVADLFQDTLLAVARSGRTIREDTKLWSWLSRIGHNQTALYWRKKSRERTVSLASEAPEASVECEVADSLEKTERRDDVRRLFSEMNAEHVSLLVSKYVDGKTVSQIVDTLGGTNESVRSKLARARRDFRQRYEKLDGESQEPPELRNWISNEGN